MIFKYVESDFCNLVGFDIAHCDANYHSLRNALLFCETDNCDFVAAAIIATGAATISAMRLRFLSETHPWLSSRCCQALQRYYVLTTKTSVTE